MAVADFMLRPFLLASILTTPCVRAVMQLPSSAGRLGEKPRTAGQTPPSQTRPNSVPFVSPFLAGAKESHADNSQNRWKVASIRWW